METVLAMYGCMMYALGYRRYRNWEWLWSVVEELGIVYGIFIVVCLIYSLLPQQNKKIINYGLINYYSIWTKMGIFELWLHTLPMC